MSCSRLIWSVLAASAGVPRTSQSASLVEGSGQPWAVKLERIVTRKAEITGGAKRVADVLMALVRDGQVVARPDGSVHQLFPVSVHPDEGVALREWVQREDARRTIEIGFGYRISTLFICQALLSAGDAAVRHAVIDPHQHSRFADIGLQLLDDAGLRTMVVHHSERSELALPTLLSAPTRFDLAFIDGNHRFDGVFVDLFYLGRLLRPGAIVFLDDYQLPSVSGAASFFIKNLGWTVEDTSTSTLDRHWIVLRTSSTPDHRPFDHFVEF